MTKYREFRFTMNALGLFKTTLHYIQYTIITLQSFNIFTEHQLTISSRFQFLPEKIFCRNSHRGKYRSSALDRRAPWT